MALTGGAAALAVLGVLFVAFVLPSWTGVLVVVVLLVLLVALDAALAARLRSLTLTRRGDSAVRLGETATVDLLLTNEGSRRLRALIRDAWPPSAGSSPRSHRVDVPAAERRTLTTVLHPTRRGDRDAVSVTVRSFGPLRLAARQRSFSVPWRVRALPPFTSRKHLPSKLAQLRELEGRTAVMLRGAGTEFDSLREYVVGDDIRAIDWRSSARRADVMVKTWRPERDRRVIIVLDTSRTSAGRVGDAPRLDAAMDAALLLAALAGRAGDRVDLLAYDRTVRARVRSKGHATASDMLPTLVNAMAPLEPELVEADMRGLATTLLATVQRRALVVLLTGLDPVGMEEGLVPVLPELTRRHTVLVGAVADSGLAEMAGRRGDVLAVYDAAAAEVARAERWGIIERLRRAGVEVVDETPEQLPPALADRYLALKAAGRL